MCLKRGANYEVVLRYSGEGSYWLTVEPPQRKYPDECISSRVRLYQRAIVILSDLRRSVCRDESDPTPANLKRTTMFFASQQPCANNDYVQSVKIAEPTFFDTDLMRG